MKRFGKNAIFMSLVLSLSLLACNGDDQKKETTSPALSQENTPKDPHDTNTKKDAAELKVGDQCAPDFFNDRCQGKDMLVCNRIDEETTSESTIYVVTKKECAANKSCTAISANGETVYYCLGANELFDSCKEAIKAEIGDGGTKDACFQTTPDDIHLREAVLEGVEGTIYELGWLSCINIAGKYFLVEAIDICRTCVINEDYSFTCEQDDSIIGANAKEGDTCGAFNFAYRRLDSKSAMICSADTNEVKKVTCPEGLELAFMSYPDSVFGSGYRYRIPVCVNSKEEECKADLFTCAASDDGGTDSFLLKGCADTDKGRHFFTKENLLDWYSSYKTPFTTAMKCGDKGCNQATGMCNK